MSQIMTNREPSQTETNGNRPPFATNEFYESLLKRKQDDPRGFERTFSDALQLTVDLYAEAKRRSEVVSIS